MLLGSFDSNAFSRLETRNPSRFRSKTRPEERVDWLTPLVFPILQSFVEGW